MSKVVIAVSPEGVVSVAAHVCGPGFCVVPVSDVGSAKHALKYGSSDSEANLMRRRIAELQRTGWKNVRVEDGSWLEQRQTARPADFGNVDHSSISGDSDGR